jgi:hypothetical protein
MTTSGFSRAGHGYALVTGMCIALALCTPPSAKANSATFRFFGAQGVDLSNYYIYFQGSTPASGPTDVQVGFTLTNSTTGSFTFDTASTGNFSILTTNQLSLASLSSVSITNLTASRMYISYGQFGEGITFTNSTYTNYGAPSRFTGGVGSSTPFQFFEGNASGGTGNFDSTFIDAYSFTYRMSNTVSSQVSGLTNFNAQAVRDALQNMSVLNGGTYPNFVTNNAGQLVSILGNGNLTTPTQFAPLDSYMDSLAADNTLVKIGWNQAAAQASGSPGDPTGRTSIQKQYGINYSENGTNYGTMAVWTEFDGRVVTNNDALAGTGFSLSEGNAHGLLLTNGNIKVAFWGGTSTNTPSDPYVVTNAAWSNASYFAQGSGATNLNVLMREAPEGTNSASFLSSFYSTNAAYGAFIEFFAGINGVADGNIVEQQYLYIDDFYAAIMMGLAGSSVADPTGTGEVRDYYSGHWWGWYDPVAFGSAQTNNSDFYDPWGAYFYDNSDGSSYGYAYSDRFIGDDALLLQYTSGQTVDVYLGETMLNTVPEPSTYALLLMSGAALVGWWVRRRR